MSSIEEVMAQSRQSDTLSKRKRFTVARSHAIRKMRRFALPDPHFYILELIQAAVANGAQHIDIVARKDLVVLSYVGGGYRQEELSQLFDFLFAPKEELEHASMRSLAIGINALLLMEPEEIIVESGDGTTGSGPLGGTTRIVIRGRENAVEVGQPDHALGGTYIRANGLKREKLRGKSSLPKPPSGARETVAIEMRCMAAPVPFLVNGEAVFGYSTMRTPNLFGYKNCISFDEGDLYGCIGTPLLKSIPPTFKLLISGCWIESVTRKFGGSKLPIGGIVAFDRLRKTADHSGIVKDDIYEELWVRLRPYVRQVQSGLRGRATYHVRRMGGDEELTPKALRSLLLKSKTAILVPQQCSPESELGMLALRIRGAVGGEVLCLPESEQAALRAIGGAELRLIQPDPQHQDELKFYRQLPISPPSQPWFIAPIELDPVTYQALNKTISDEFGPSASKALQSRLPPDLEFKITLYAPKALGASDQLRLRLITVDRLLWEGGLRSPYPGLVADVRLSDLPPGKLNRAWPSGALKANTTNLCQQLATGLANHLDRALSHAADRVIWSLREEEVSPGSIAGKAVLAKLSRESIKRVVDDRIVFSLDGAQRGLDLRTLAIVQTLEGRAMSLNDLEHMLQSQCGLIYGVTPELSAHLDGLATDRILSLDVFSEHHLIALLGEASYVRVDQRKALSSSIPALRAIAIGLQQYPEHPLLLEGSTSQAPPVDEALSLLLGLVHDRDPLVRRHAIRHLQWYLCKNEERPSKVDQAARNLPLFLDEAGRPLSYSQLFLHGNPMMTDGRGLDAASLESSLPPLERLPDGAPVLLSINPFLFGLLQGRITGAVEHELRTNTTEDAPNTSVAVVSAPVAQEGLVGELWLPEVLHTEPTITVVSQDFRKVFRLRAIALDYGLVGRLHAQSRSVLEDSQGLRFAIELAATDVLRKTMASLPKLSGPAYERAVSTLLAFAGRRTMVQQRSDGNFEVEVRHSLARAIIELPLFPTQGASPVSAMRLFQELETFGRYLPLEVPLHQRFEQVDLNPDMPGYLKDWLQEQLSIERTIHPTSQEHRPARPVALVFTSLKSPILSC